MKHLHNFRRPNIITIFAYIICPFFILFTTGCTEIERVSVDSQGQQVFGSSGNASISKNGRFVAFVSDSDDLVPFDNNRNNDIFVFDRLTGFIERVSVASGGAEANDWSGYPAISADGRFVAFASNASNLVANDNNRCRDIFIRDRKGTGITERVSVAPNGDDANESSYIPVISADGRFVAFASDAYNLTSNDYDLTHNIIVRDRKVAASMEKMNIASNGEEASSLVSNDSGYKSDIFIRDRQEGITEQVSVASNGGETNMFSWMPAISADGRFVAFASYATNLIPNDNNSNSNIFVRDRQEGVTELVSVTSTGEALDYHSYSPTISGDGRFVAFRTHRRNIFVRDRQEGVTELVSVELEPTVAIESDLPSISADGRFVVFISRLAHVFPDDDWDIFVRDRQKGVTERVSVALNSDEANASSYHSVISADGRFVAFTSGASNLIPNDTNESSDVFVAPNPLFLYLKTN